MERMLALERGHHVKKLASSDNALSVLQCEQYGYRHLFDTRTHGNVC